MRILILFVVMLFLFVACGGQNGTQQGDEEATTGVTAGATDDLLTPSAVATHTPEEESGDASAMVSATPPANPGPSATAISDTPTPLPPAVTAPAGENVIPAAPTTAFNPQGFNPDAGSNFPALDNPRIVSVTAVTWLQPDDLVLGVEVNGESRAYPVMQAAYHHVINDEIAGEPYLVTF